ncbi:hypothetical protein BDQ17DRAFT_1323193 [Cyathus striatus]|nr:hypothetical protein BDQ17DRAFT_1323193 [Cyathus striatus]
MPSLIAGNGGNLRSLGLNGLNQADYIQPPAFSCRIPYRDNHGNLSPGEESREESQALGMRGIWQYEKVARAGNCHNKQGTIRFSIICISPIKSTMESRAVEAGSVDVTLRTLSDSQSVHSETYAKQNIPILNNTRRKHNHRRDDDLSEIRRKREKVVSMDQFREKGIIDAEYDTGNEGIRRDSRVRPQKTVPNGVGHQMDNRAGFLIRLRNNREGIWVKTQAVNTSKFQPRSKPAVSLPMIKVAMVAWSRVSFIEANRSIIHYIRAAEVGYRPLRSLPDKTGQICILGRWDSVVTLLHVSAVNDYTRKLQRGGCLQLQRMNEKRTRSKIEITDPRSKGVELVNERECHLNLDLHGGEGRHVWY